MVVKGRLPSEAKGLGFRPFMLTFDIWKTVQRVNDFAQFACDVCQM